MPRFLSVVAFVLFLSSCGGGGGGGGDSGNQNVTPAPTVNISSTLSEVQEGESVELSWSSSNANSCTASGDWSGSKGTNGTETVGPLGADSAFSLQCTGAGGSNSASVNVTVVPKPVVTLTATPAQVGVNETIQLDWSSINAVSCAITTPISQSLSATSGTAGITVSGPGDITVVVECTGPGGTGTATADVQVIAPPTLDFSADRTSLIAGQDSVTLSWSSTNATNCTPSGSIASWTGLRTPTGSQTIGPFGADEYVFTLTCNGPGGSVSQSVSIVAIVPPAPTVTLAAIPPSVAQGANTTINWSSSEATTCSASGGWSGEKTLNGSEEVGPVQATTDFFLECVGAGGSVQQVVTVTLLPMPTVAISAVPETIAIGESTTVTWTSSDATSCVAEGAWSGARSTSGSEQLSPPATATFTLRCTGDGGETTDSVVVTVTEPAPTVQLSALEPIVPWGSGTTLVWDSTDATTCTASGGWSGDRTTAGSELIDPVPNTTIYAMSCENSGGSVNAQAQVTVVDVDGTYLPPDPGPSNDLTLDGIDANLNGVRDDVERHIAENYRESARLRESLKSLATSYGNAIGVRNSASESLALAHEFFANANCAEAIRPDTYLEALRDIRRQFLDTLDRLGAFAQFGGHLAGETYDISLSPTGESSCSFDWSVLPN